MSRFLYWDPTDGVEDIRRYTTGGYHRICLGDVVSWAPLASSSLTASPPRRYRILHKLGQGDFSTVWFAEALHAPSQQYVAVKICVADGDPEQERHIFRQLSEHKSTTTNVVQLRDSFVLEGPNGVHNVLVYDVLGSLFRFIHSNGGYKHMKTLCHQVVCGLAALHRLGIVHGDLHAGNVGIALPTLNEHSPSDILDYFGHPHCDIIVPSVEPALPQALPPYLVHSISVDDYISKDPKFMGELPRAEILDLGNATVAGDPARPASALPRICAPEITFVAVVHPDLDWPPSTRASDIWSLACTIYKLAFGTELFDFAVATDASLGAMAVLCGEVPPEWRSYWDSRDELRNISVSRETADAEWQKRLEYLTNGGERRYLEPDVTEIIRLLRSMLKFDSGCRPTAEDLLGDPWFRSLGETIIN